MNATASSRHQIKSKTTSRGAPLMRAVMRSFSHSKKKGKHPSHQSSSITCSSSSVAAEEEQHLSSSHHNPQQEDFPFKGTLPVHPHSPHTLSQQDHSLSKPSLYCAMPSPSSPIKCKDVSFHHHMDTTSHESVDWTNATEATSFSEHDEVADNRLSTIADESNSMDSETNNKITIKAMMSQNDHKDEDECDGQDEANSQNDVDSTSSSSSFTCDTSECAIKVLQRHTEDDEQEDDQSWNDLPLVITLLNDNVHNTDREVAEAPADNICDVGPESSMSPLTLVSKQQRPLTNYETALRLERAEAMLESYRNTLRSNEHLIESLEQTLMETRESAQDLWSERNRLEQELEETLDEQDSLIMTEKNCLVRKIHTGILALSLLYFMMGGSEYVLIFVATVYLLEDVMTMCL
jgi:hypothetical protein